MATSAEPIRAAKPPRPAKPAKLVRPAKPVRLAESVHIAKHSLLIAGHRTSVSLEDAFWSALRRLAADRGQSVATLVAAIDAERGDANLSSTIRVYLLETLMASVPAEI